MLLQQRHNIQQEIPRQLVYGRVHEQDYGKTWKICMDTYMLPLFGRVYKKYMEKYMVSMLDGDTHFHDMQ